MVSKPKYIIFSKESTHAVYKNLHIGDTQLKPEQLT